MKGIKSGGHNSSICGSLANETWCSAGLSNNSGPAFPPATLIAEGIAFDGLDEPVKLVHADNVASGRALRQVEDFVMERVLPHYANTITEGSCCGGNGTRTREQACTEIAPPTNAGLDCSVIFAGSGATAGLNRPVKLLGIEQDMSESQHADLVAGKEFEKPDWVRLSSLPPDG